MGKVKTTTDKIVLVGVLKDRRDLHILLTQHWYRIPASQAPARPFHKAIRELGGCMRARNYKAINTTSL